MEAPERVGVVWAKRGIHTKMCVGVKVYILQISYNCIYILYLWLVGVVGDVGEEGGPELGREVLHGVGHKHLDVVPHRQHREARCMFSQIADRKGGGGRS